MLRSVFARTSSVVASNLRGGPSARLFSSSAQAARNVFAKSGFTMVAGSTAAALVGLGVSVVQCADVKPDWAKVREDVKAILDEDGYDDGSIGPLLIRLAWHSSGTYDAKSKTGGSDGATMRFAPEANHGANAGLIEARKRLEKIQATTPGLSFADLYILASVVAVEEMGGPKIPFRPGRADKPSGEWCTPDGRLPDADKGTKPGTIAHIKDIFYRMGMNDQEIVALCGAHALGRCHKDRSGYLGPWTRAPTTFSNEYFRLLIETKWVKKQWSGPMQYENADGGDLMMLPADLALVEDKDFRPWVEVYAKDEKRFFNDFSKAYAKLTELGCNNLERGTK